MIRNSWWRKWLLPVCCLLSASHLAWCSDKEKITLIVSHPSERALNSFVYLVQTGKFSVPAPLHVVVVYHANEAKALRDCIKYVRTEKLLWIEFREIIGAVAVPQLFGSNAWTSQFEQLFAMSDGILFLGGPDIMPKVYGEKTSLLCEISPTPQRHLYETSLLFHLLGGSQNRTFKPLLRSRPLYPIMGICLGAQTMNVAAGGTLYQDIPQEIYGLIALEDILGSAQVQHKNYHRTLTGDDSLDYASLHPIVIKDNSPMPCSLPEPPLVSSSHHQCIARLADDFVTWATSPDGKIAEAIYHKEFQRVFGVQFHPERRSLWDKSLAQPLTHESKETTTDIFLKHSASLIFHDHLWKQFATYLQEAYQQRPR